MSETINPYTSGLASPYADKPQALREAKAAENTTQINVQRNFLGIRGIVGVAFTTGAMGADPATAISNMIASYFKTFENIAENLGVSKEQMEAHEKRVEELREIERKRKDEEIDDREAEIQVRNILQSPAVQQLVAKALDPYTDIKA